ncbi:hypothetical protein QBC35DRAFT_284627 [Podospora australis]|uniref:Uncharacterized protein n=1 Tax=Podospora australis TaxID=1536484 RepID=A0AAN6WTC8_9PEZI|nr:hypothetical protein QBC35DRAFT_284627 [Podospora australis]
MSGEEDTEEWEPIPSLSSLSPFSSPALSFLVLGTESAPPDSDGYSHQEINDQDDVASLTHSRTQTPPIKTPTPSPPGTARQSQFLDNQTPSSPTTPIGLGRVGLGLGRMNLSFHSKPPLHHGTPSWLSPGYLDGLADEDKSFSHDADDEDESDEETGWHARNRRVVKIPVSGDEITRDSRDILVERLEDLLKQLSLPEARSTEAGIMGILHAKVDEMERALENRHGPMDRGSRPAMLQLSQSTLTQRSNNESMPDTLSPSASFPPPWLLATPVKPTEVFSESPTQPELAAATNEALEAVVQAARAQDEMTARVAAEAEKLRDDLARVVQRLQERREETEHLHELLIHRAEGAAERILDLEKELSDLEDDLASSESELRHLRLKLRAVETLVHEFIPEDADPDLLQSIENWKADWMLVRNRLLERKRGRKERRKRLRRRSIVDGVHDGDPGGDDRGEESTLTSLGNFSVSVADTLQRGT